jgi:hypothetical protein
MGALSLHVLAMGAWLGGLVGLGLSLAHRRHVRSLHREALMLRRFATLAALYVGGGLLGGVVIVLLAMPAVSSLWESSWGLVIAGKVVAVAVVLGLALFNRGARVPPEPPEEPTRPLLAGTPAFAVPGGDAGDAGDADYADYADYGEDDDRGQSRRGLRIRLGVEAGVLAVAAAVSAALVQADPGAGSREYLRVVPMGNRVAAVQSEDLTAGRPMLRFYVRTYGGRTDTEVDRLSIRLRAPDGTTGRRYDLTRPPQRETFDTHLDLPASGRWTMQLSYRVSDVDQADATIVLSVG